MKKRIIAVILTAALCTMMSATALAAGGVNSSNTSSSSSSSSSSSKKSSSHSSSSVETPATRGTANTDEISVAVPNADGTVSTVNLTKFTEQVDNAIVSVAANSANPGEAVSAALTAPASDIFKATINVLGGKIRMVNAGGYKVVATAPGADGRTIASVGAVRGVTKYAFVVLTAVNADGTVEIVEGTVDPVTLQVMGAFNGTPVTITVSVIMAAQ